MINERHIGRFTVAGQVADEELQTLKGRGYGMVVNVCPTEELGEPEEPKVLAAGLAYANVPFTRRTLTREHVQRVREAIGRAGGYEVLIH